MFVFGAQSCEPNVTLMQIFKVLGFHSRAVESLVILTLENKTTKLSQNVGHQSFTNKAPHPRTM